MCGHHASGLFIRAGDFYWQVRPVLHHPALRPRCCHFLSGEGVLPPFTERAFSSPECAGALSQRWPPKPSIGLLAPNAFSGTSGQAPRPHPLAGGSSLHYALELEGQHFLVWDDMDSGSMIVSPIERWNFENLLESIDDPMPVLSVNEITPRAFQIMAGRVAAQPAPAGTTAH